MWCGRRRRRCALCGRWKQSYRLWRGRCSAQVRWGWSCTEAGEAVACLCVRGAGLQTGGTGGVGSMGYGGAGAAVFPSWTAVPSLTRQALRAGTTTRDALKESAAQQGRAARDVLGRVESLGQAVRHMHTHAHWCSSRQHENCSEQEQLTEAAPPVAAVAPRGRPTGRRALCCTVPHHCAAVQVRRDVAVELRSSAAEEMAAMGRLEARIAVSASGLAGRPARVCRLQSSRWPRLVCLNKPLRRRWRVL